MILKKTHEGENIPTSLSELVTTLRSSLERASYVKHICDNPFVENGVAIKSVNKVKINKLNFDYSEEILYININDSELILEIHNDCNLLTYDEIEGEIFRVVFVDLHTLIILL